MTAVKLSPCSSTAAMNNNAANLQSAMDWLAELVSGALSVHFAKVERFEAPALGYRDDDSWLPRFIQRQNPTPEEFAILMLALVPHLDPGLLGKLIAAAPSRRRRLSRVRWRQRCEPSRHSADRRDRTVHPRRRRSREAPGRAAHSRQRTLVRAASTSSGSSRCAKASRR